jgi:hypothetical protein
MPITFRALFQGSFFSANQGLPIAFSCHKGLLGVGEEPVKGCKQAVFHTVIGSTGLCETFFGETIFISVFFLGFEE